MGQSMSASAAYEELLSLGARASSAGTVAAMRKIFEARTGAFGPEDAWFEARGQAFWDDALTTQRFAARLEAERTGPTKADRVAESASTPGERHPLLEDTRAWAQRFERAQRGLFRAVHEARSFLLEDLWGGAEFAIDAPAGALASALEAACGDGGEEQLFDGRLVGRANPFSVTLLPGAVFHRAEAKEAIASMLTIAKSRGMSRDDSLDALLRMDRKLQSHARVKPGYAYRSELLSPPTAS